MPKVETNAIELENGNYGCPKCKSDKLKFVAHADGKDFYSYIYNCIECQKVITIKKQRDKLGRMLWE